MGGDQGILYAISPLQHKINLNFQFNLFYIEIRVSL